MSEQNRSVRVIVTQTITECLETIVSVPGGAGDQDIANLAVAQVLDREQGWTVTENPWSVEIVEGGNLGAALSPDFAAVDAIRQGRA